MSENGGGGGGGGVNIKRWRRKNSRKFTYKFISQSGTDLKRYQSGASPFLGVII